MRRARAVGDGKAGQNARPSLRAGKGNDRAAAVAVDDGRVDDAWAGRFGRAQNNVLAAEVDVFKVGCGENDDLAAVGSGVDGGLDGKVIT